jgi:hypothetical protein
MMSNDAGSYWQCLGISVMVSFWNRSHQKDTEQSIEGYQAIYQRPSASSVTSNTSVWKKSHMLFAVSEAPFCSSTSIKRGAPSPSFGTANSAAGAHVDQIILGCSLSETQLHLVENRTDSLLVKRRIPLPSWQKRRP